MQCDMQNAEKGLNLVKERRYVEGTTSCLLCKLVFKRIGNHMRAHRQAPHCKGSKSCTCATGFKPKRTKPRRSDDLSHDF